MTEKLPSESYDHRLVFNAAKDGKLYRLKSYFETIPAYEIQTLVNTRTNGSTPLVMSCQRGNVKMTKYLVNNCNADIELTGSVILDGETIAGTPPLWCAAAAGHFDIVKFLITKGANVNSTTQTNSTPLRAACFDGYYDIVVYLIDHGASIEFSNRHGHTCLMIASYKGHIEIVKYLLQQKAEINRKTMKGNTALHDCAESGNLDILKLLIANGAVIAVDSYGMTPLLAASVTGHTEIVSYMVGNTNLATRSESIDALELLGATFIDKGRSINAAYSFWKLAMEMRYDSKYPPLLKSSIEPVAAYENAREVLNMQELEAISSVPDAMRIQALLIRERILGPAHPDTSYYIRFRGAVYADAGRFSRCIALWTYALEIQQRALEPMHSLTQSSIVSFTELFSMLLDSHTASGGTGYTPSGMKIPNINFDDIMMVWHKSMNEVKAGYDMRYTDGFDQSLFERILGVTLQLVAVLAKLLPQLTEEQQRITHQELYKFTRLGYRTRQNCSLIHLACYGSSSVIVRNASCRLPSAPLVRMLCRVGVDVNVRDAEGNTPLHFAALSNDETVVKELLEAGAHLDTVNDARLSFSMLWSKPINQLVTYPLKHVSLQCLAARVIRNHNIEVNRGDLPDNLYDFMIKH